MLDVESSGLGSFLSFFLSFWILDCVRREHSTCNFIGCIVGHVV